MPTARPRSPLFPVLALTGLASFAAGTTTLSVFFVTARAPFAFTAAQQYALGLLVGVTYTLGAFHASRVRRLAAGIGVSARALIAGLGLAMALLSGTLASARSAGGAYLLVGLYAPLTGVLWPLVEAYVSGGRRGAELRGAVGRFNVVWSATLLPSFLVPSLLAERPERVFLAVAGAHLASLVLLVGFRREPGEHAADEPHAVPRGYPELLRVHRVLHATSYLVMYALAPYLPALLGQLGVEPRARGALAATWLAARTLGFGLFERWHGWHGRGFVAVAGTGLVLGGFAATLLAPSLGLGLGVVLGALALFGLGLAALYTAALYYAFEVGGHEGGGGHEALIGLGYSIGPACGLLVCLLERRGTLAAERRDLALLAVISALCVLGALLAWLRRRAPSAGP